jgi:hypothetical protein
VKEHCEACGQDVTECDGLRPAAQAVLEAAVTWHEAQAAWGAATPPRQGTANSLWDESWPPFADVLSAETALLDAIRQFVTENPPGSTPPGDIKQPEVRG